MWLFVCLFVCLFVWISVFLCAVCKRTLLFPRVFFYTVCVSMSAVYSLRVGGLMPLTIALEVEARGRYAPMS